MRTASRRCSSVSLNPILLTSNATWAQASHSATLSLYLMHAMSDSRHDAQAISEPGAQVTRYLGYSSLKDFFPTMEIRPNPGCANALCARRQAEAAAAAASPEARRMTWLALWGG